MRNFILFVASDLSLSDSEVNKKGSGYACSRTFVAAIASVLRAALLRMKDGHAYSARRNFNDQIHFKQKEIGQ